MRKDGILHERWRWGMDPSLLPPGLRIVHPGKKGKNLNQVQFVWRRPGDGLWAMQGWELVIDRDGEGQGEVLARFKEETWGIKKKGEVEFMQGLGKPWEYLVLVTVNAVLGKETQQAIKLAT